MVSIVSAVAFGGTRSSARHASASAPSLANAKRTSSSGATGAGVSFAAIRRGPAASANSAVSPPTNAIWRSATNAASRSAITTRCGLQ